MRNQTININIDEIDNQVNNFLGCDKNLSSLKSTIDAEKILLQHLSKALGLVDISFLSVKKDGDKC